MADVADTRGVLDDAAEALSKASHALSGLERGLFHYAESIAQRVPEAMSDAEQARERLKLVGGRVAVRLKADHPALAPIVKAHEATQAAVNATFRLTPSAPGETGEAFETVQTEHRRLIDATDEFMRAAVESVGARLGD